MTFAPKSWHNAPDTPLSAEAMIDLEDRLAGYTDTSAAASVAPFSQKPMVDPVRDLGADPTGSIDATTAINNALTAGSIQGSAGTFLINGIVNVPLNRDFNWAGASTTIFKMGAGGQIVFGNRAVNTSYVGGHAGGFTIDGNNVQNVAGGGLYIGFCLCRTWSDITIKNCVGDNWTIETAQNCYFANVNATGAGRSNLVLDYGAGGHTFIRCEINSATSYDIEFRQTGPSPGGYPTYSGPSNNIFIGGITEYGGAASGATVYHGAGIGNQFISWSFSPAGSLNAAEAALIMEVAANAVTTTLTQPVAINDTTIQVANTANLSLYMTVNLPGFAAGTKIWGITGNVLTLSASATATALSGATVTFGAESNELILANPGFFGTNSDVGIDMRGGTNVTMYGRPIFSAFASVFKTTSTDKVILHNPYDVENNTAWWTQQIDTGTVPCTAAYVISGYEEAPHLIGAAGEAAFGAHWQYANGEGWKAPSYHLDASGRVILQGMLRSTAAIGAAANDVICILPVGYRPVVGNQAPAGLLNSFYVMYDGHVYYYGPAIAAGTEISLDFTFSRE